MPSVVVDTDVLSYEFKGDSRAQLYHRHLTGVRWIISFQTLAELDWWAAKHRWGHARREQLDAHLHAVRVYFADRDLCRNWAEVNRRSAEKGGTITCADAWIAATAITLGIPLVTHNPDDFGRIEGLAMLTAES